MPLLSLYHALHRIRSTPPRVIASPPTRNLPLSFFLSYSRLTHFLLEPRRAAVALIIRVVPPPNFPLPPKSTPPPSLSDFFELDWVKHPSARPEILFVRRQKPERADINENIRDAHVAFPGGRSEPGDEGSLYTGRQPLSLHPRFLLMASFLLHSHASDLGRGRPRPC